MKKKTLIFRTSISKRQDIRRVGMVLDECGQVEKWNVDFEDWEKVLRIECNEIEVSEITAMLRSINIHVVELD